MSNLEVKFGVIKKSKERSLGLTMITKFITLTLFFTVIISSCSFQKTHNDYINKYMVEGSSSNELVKKLRKLSTSSRNINQKIIINSPEVRKEDISFSNSGSVTGHTLFLTIPIQILKNNKVLFEKRIEASSYLKKLDTPHANQENFDRAMSNLYDKIFLSIKIVLKSLNES